MHLIFNKMSVDELLDAVSLKKKAVTRRSENSLSYLIDRPMEQSECIRLGTAMESALSQITEQKTTKNLKNIKPPNKKGKKEKDILFEDLDQIIIWYFEAKSNIELDTEKLAVTVKKIKELKKDNNYAGGLLALRWLSKKDIPENLAKKYKDLGDDEIYGVNDYFNAVDVPYNFKDYDEYKKFVNGILAKITQ